MTVPTKAKKLLTTAELAQATAGGDDYIRTKNNEVRGLALRFDYNPDLPDAIAYGTGPRVKARAKMFFESGLAVPAYVKRDTNSWEYLGDYRATALRTDTATIQKYGTNREPGTTAGVLFLEAVGEPKVQISGGGFADPETRKEVEAAAIAFVSSELKRRGFEVHDHQRENRGYDLLAISPSDGLHVEVKGTDSLEPRFFLTRNESQYSCEHEEWRLFVVCKARNNPVLYEYTATEMRRQFKFDPLAWECIQNDS